MTMLNILEKELIEGLIIKSQKMCHVICAHLCWIFQGWIDSNSTILVVL